MTDPIVLLDEPEDERCEARGWVEATVSEARARALLAPYCADENGDMPARPVGVAKRVSLRLDNPDAHHDDQRWVPCGFRARDGRTFYEFDATETLAPAER